MRTVYMLANSTATLPALSTHLIRTLFMNLGDDALKFLAGFWLHSDPTTSASPAVFASLRHAAAFLEAHFATQRWIDFQTVLPALLVALQHSDRRIREATLECVSALIRLSQATKPTGIYAFDVIYGATSGASLEEALTYCLTVNHQPTCNIWNGMTSVDTCRPCIHLGTISSRMQVTSMSSTSNT